MNPLVTVLGHVLSEVPPFPTPPGEYGPCIQTSRLAVEVLSQLKVPARVSATRCVAVNAAAIPLVNARVPFDEWPAEAWSVGIDIGTEHLGDMRRAEPYRRKGSVGHAVVLGEDFVLDGTAGQLSRPEHRMVVPDVLLLERLPGSVHLECWLDDGAAIEYQLAPRVAAFRWSNAWQAKLSLDLVAEYVNLVVALVTR